MSERFALSDFRSLLPAGWDHARAHAALTRLLSEAGDGGAACLFAPVASDGSGVVFSPPPIGDRLPYERLEPAQREALRAELGRLASLLRRRAIEKAAQDPTRAGELPALVAAALEIPSFAHVEAWAGPGAKGRPLLVGWGLLPISAPAPLGLVSRLDDGRPATFVRRVAPRELAVAGVALLVVGVAGTLLAPWLMRAGAQPETSCTVAPGQMAAMDELLREEQRTRELRSRLAALETELGTRRAACPLPEPPPPPPPPPEPARPAPPPPAQPPPAARPPAQPPAQAQPARPRSADQQRARERGGREGQLEIVLAWGSRRDIDLLVTCPSGETVWARSPRACGGSLDVDANGSGNPRVDDPVEHVVFANPPMGSYRVQVANCEATGGGESYRVTVIYKGEVIRQTSGSVPVTRLAMFLGQGCGTPQTALEFRLPP